MKKVFITGASRGIGRAMALLFAENGYEVGFCYRQSHADAESLCKEISAFTKASSFCCDLANMHDVMALPAQIEARMGHMDVWINNAGASHFGLIQDVSEEEYDRLFNVNFKSMFFLTQAAAEKMIAVKKGSIINLSSVWGQTGASCEVLYSASKAAVVGFTKALAKELAPSGIRVNCIAPGVVDTDMMQRFSPTEKKNIAGEIPMQRFGRPQEIAQLALFLADERSSYITGQVLAVNGGFIC